MGQATEAGMARAWIEELHLTRLQVKPILAGFVYDVVRCQRLGLMLLCAGGIL